MFSYVYNILTAYSNLMSLLLNNINVVQFSLLKKAIMRSFNLLEGSKIKIRNKKVMSVLRITVYQINENYSL